jgi:hypothetical protein
MRVVRAATLAASLTLLGAAPAGARGACPTGIADSSAKELARTAQTTAATYSTDHEGLFSGLSPLVLHRYERSITISASDARRHGELAYLSAALPIEHGEGFIVRARTVTGRLYSLLDRRDGQVTRTARICGRYTSW